MLALEPSVALHSLAQFFKIKVVKNSCHFIFHLPNVMKQTVQIFTSFQAVFQSCFIKHQRHCYIITGMEGILNTLCKGTSNNFFAKIFCEFLSIVIVLF